MSFSDLLQSLEVITRKKNNCLYGKEIVQCEDEFGTIRLFESRKKRTLTFDSAFEQSCIDMKFPYRMAHQYTRAMLLPTFYRQPNRALILGLGGGALTQFLHHFFEECRIDVVELRESVINLTKQHLNLPDTHRLTLFHQDAHIFIRNALPDSYDMVFSDLYLAEGMDQRQATLSHICNCFKLVTEEGWLACNLILPDGVKYDFIDRLSSLCQTLYLCNLKEGNSILLCSRQNYDLTELPTPAHSKPLHDLCGFDMRDYQSCLIRFS